MYCKKCLTGRTGDVVGQPCRTPNCDGIIEEEPNWVDLVETLPEPMTCGRRFDCYPGGIPAHQDRGKGQDHWEKFKSNGNRVCSYCGSLHPEDLFELVRQCANASLDAAYGTVPEIEPSDKGYKIYVHQPGVRNAHEGGIKFYMQHLPRGEDGKLAVSEERNDEYRRAVRATKVRFARYMSVTFGVRGNNSLDSPTVQ